MRLAAAPAVTDGSNGSVDNGNGGGEGSRGRSAAGSITLRISDAQGSEVINVFGNQRPKLFALNFNIAHDMEHYGNMVTYMRIRGMTPPSSQRGN